MEEDKIQQLAVIPAEKEKDNRLRKRKILEAATGTAWGAKSYSAAKITSFKEGSNDPGYDDFGRYFAEKQRKLRDQYRRESTSTVLRDAAAAAAAQHDGSELVARAETPPGRSNTLIFQGVSVFVDGFTIPTHQELRFIMMNNGGVFENYFSRQTVTHIICSTLPDNKIMNPRMLSRGLPIVKPEWIVESMKAKKLLPWEIFQLERIAYAHPAQQTISARFAAFKDVSVPRKVDVLEGQGTSNQLYVKKFAKHDCEGGIQGEPSGAVNQNGNSDSAGHGAPGLLQENTKGKPQSLLENTEQSPHPEQVITAGGEVGEDGKTAHASDVQEDHAAKSAQANLVPGELMHRPCGSSLNDTHFVKNFFKRSRLHFIGTWRTRYLSLASSFGTNGELKSKDREMMEANSDGKPMVIHLDMDCFFVSVVVRNRPDLLDKPVAVCHSDSDKGTAEISSANYSARSYGIKAGMFVRNAKALCPDLKIVSYDFAGYEEVADKVYNILHYHCSKVEAVSCDEAFLDVAGHPDPVDLASRIREEIYAETRCSASAGIAENLLLARLATKRAKPNGQYFVKSEEVRQFMGALPVEELPGVGWALREKLHCLKLFTCADLLCLSKDILQKQFGTKTGNMLWCFAQGIDDRGVQLVHERKSIGAEVNWGVRFETTDDAQKFLVSLSNEVATRLQNADTCGRTITLKIKKRKENAGEPFKYLGHGICDSLSRSETLGYSTSSQDVLLRIGRQLYASLRIEPEDVRGMGLQVSRLESKNAGTEKRNQALDSWLVRFNRIHQAKEEVHQKKGSFPLQKGEPRDPCSKTSDHLKRETDIVKKEESGERRERETAEGQLPSEAAVSPPADENERSVHQILNTTGRNVIKLRTPQKGQRPGVSTHTRKSKNKTSLVKAERSPFSGVLDPASVSRHPQQSKAARKVSFGVTELGEEASVVKQTTGHNECSSDPLVNTVKCDSEPLLHSQLAYYSTSGLSKGDSNPVGQKLLQQILQWVRTKSSDRLSVHLLRSGCYSPVGDIGDTADLKKTVEQCAKILTLYVRDTASRDLEEIHLILRYMKRLGGRCKLWRAIEELARPAFEDIVGKLYGGNLTHGFRAP
ncbi:hypothetical protein R1flu_027634 [Riccia fluitans]|uniref:DNA polymerase kappa n=1 Tax=Riccia fluitans TaxID=41844 RepID=A0ABD1XM75_9MARC